MGYGNGIQISGKNRPSGPIPGTGAWTGTLGASFLNMGFKSTVVAVSLGVILAGGIMGLASAGVFHIFGL